MQAFTATVLVAFSMAAPHPKAPSHIPNGCSKHFTIPMAERAIAANYTGTRDVSDHDRRKLGWYVRCQWDTRHRPALHREWGQAIRNWKARRNPPFQWAYVSYYDDSGTHCCGTYAEYGVAVCGSSGVCVPQGTHIEFCDRRCVVATADDHGPYVGGRDFDLSESTAGAIGFGGLGSVRYRILP